MDPRISNTCTARGAVAAFERRTAGIPRCSEGHLAVWKLSYTSGRNASEMELATTLLAPSILESRSVTSVPTSHTSLDVFLLRGSQDSAEAKIQKLAGDVKLTSADLVSREERILIVL